MAEYIPNGLLIKKLHDSLEKRSNNELRKKGLTMMQVSFLLTLNEAEQQRLSMKELERHFAVAQSTAAGIVSRLEQKGLVEALSDESDKRIKLVHITSAGQDCCDDAAHNMECTEQTLLCGFSDKEREELNSLLKRALENLK